MIVENLLNAKVKRKASLVLWAASLALLAQVPSFAAEDVKVERAHKTIAHKALPEARDVAYEHADVEDKDIVGVKKLLADMDAVEDIKSDKFLDTEPLADSDEYNTLFQDAKIGGAFLDVYEALSITGTDLKFTPKKFLKVKRAVNKAVSDFLDTFRTDDKLTDVSVLTTAWDELAKQIKARETKIFTREEEAERLEAERIFKEKEAEAEKVRLAAEEAERLRQEQKKKDMEKRKKIMKRKAALQKEQAVKRMEATGQLSGSTVTDDTGKIHGKTK